MKQYFSLLKVLLRGEDINDPHQKHKKVFYGTLGAIAIFGIMLPACALIGFLTYYMTLALQAVGGDSQALLLMLQFICAFSMVFGINVICNVFYFSGDNPHLLVMPLSPVTVISAKFTAAYINESVMEFLVILSALFGYVVAVGISPWKIFVTLFGMITVPLVPLCYCGIIAVLFMSTTKVFRNKENVRKIAGVMSVLLIVLLASTVNLLGGFDIDTYVVQLVSGDNAFSKGMNILFPQLTLLVAGVNGSVVGFLLYLLVNVLFVSVFLILAHFLYYGGMVGLSIEGTKRRGRPFEKILDGCRIHSIRRTYFLKEMKILLRTPAFLTNCILVNLLWPVLALIVIKLQSNSGSFWKMVYLYVTGNERMQVMVPLLFVVVGVLVTAANSIASSGITREGKQEFVLHYLPLDMWQQFKIKIMVSECISGGFVTLYILICCLPLHVPLVAIFYYLVLAWLSVLFVSYFGLFLDTVNPKLLWEDELNALRGNANIFFNMAYAMLMGCFLAGLIWILYDFTPISAFVIQMLLLFVLILLCVLFRELLRGRAKRYLS